MLHLVVKLDILLQFGCTFSIINININTNIIKVPPPNLPFPVHGMLVDIFINRLHFTGLNKLIMSSSQEYLNILYVYLCFHDSIKYMLYSFRLWKIGGVCCVRFLFYSLCSQTVRYTFELFIKVLYQPLLKTASFISNNIASTFSMHRKYFNTVTNIFHYFV